MKLIYWTLKSQLPIYLEKSYFLQLGTHIDKSMFIYDTMIRDDVHVLLILLIQQKGSVAVQHYVYNI